MSDPEKPAIPQRRSHARGNNKNEKAVTRKRLYSMYYLGSANLNGTLAAEMAGCAAKSARTASQENQANPFVRALIDKGLEERERELKDRAIEALEHTIGQAVADMGDLFDEDGNPLPLGKMPKGARRAIQSIDVEWETITENDGTVKRRPRLAHIKLCDQRSSQELLYRYAGKLEELITVDGALTLEGWCLGGRWRAAANGAP
jgi:phage terminase small subunit